MIAPVIAARLAAESASVGVVQLWDACVSLREALHPEKRVCGASPRGVEIAKQLKEQSGPKLKDFRALLEKGVPQPIEDLKMEVLPSIPLAQIPL